MRGVGLDDREPVEHADGDEHLPRRALLPGGGEHRGRGVVGQQRAQRGVGQHQLVRTRRLAVDVGEGERGQPVARRRGPGAQLGDQAEHRLGQRHRVQPGLGVVHRAVDRVAQRRVVEQPVRARRAWRRAGPAAGARRPGRRRAGRAARGRPTPPRRRPAGGARPRARAPCGRRRAGRAGRAARRAAPARCRRPVRARRRPPATRRPAGARRAAGRPARRGPAGARPARRAARPRADRTRRSGKSDLPDAASLGRGAAARSRPVPRAGRGRRRRAARAARERAGPGRSRRAGPPRRRPRRAARPRRAGRRAAARAGGRRAPSAGTPRRARARAGRRGRRPRRGRGRRPAAARRTVSVAAPVRTRRRSGSSGTSAISRAGRPSRSVVAVGACRTSSPSGAGRPSASSGRAQQNDRTCRPRCSTAVPTGTLRGAPDQQPAPCIRPARRSRRSRCLSASLRQRRRSEPPAVDVDLDEVGQREQQVRGGGRRGGQQLVGVDARAQRQPDLRRVPVGRRRLVRTRRPHQPQHRQLAVAAGQLGGRSGQLAHGLRGRRGGERDPAAAR